MIVSDLIFKIIKIGVLLGGAIISAGLILLFIKAMELGE